MPKEREPQDGMQSSKKSNDIGRKCKTKKKKKKRNEKMPKNSLSIESKFQSGQCLTVIVCQLEEHKRCLKASNSHFQHSNKRLSIPSSIPKKSAGRKKKLSLGSEVPSKPFLRSGFQFLQMAKMLLPYNYSESGGVYKTVV